MINEWEKVFDDRFGDNTYSNIIDAKPEQMKDFIRSTLNNQLVTLLEEMPEKANPNYGKKWEDGLQETHEATSEGYNQALKAVEDLIKSKIQS